MFKAIDHGCKKEDDKKELRRHCSIAAPVLRNLLEQAQEERDNLIKAPRKSQYDKPAWGEYQAHCNGNLETLDDLIRVIEGAIKYGEN